jgi:NAD/NADP transhydrogenase alpha subunit
VPKETLHGERRVAITPSVAASLIKKGFTVNVESGAGVEANFKDAGNF